MSQILQYEVCTDDKNGFVAGSAQYGIGFIGIIPRASKTSRLLFANAKIMV
jgi:hypothetical protein